MKQSNPYHDADLAGFYGRFEYDGTYFLLGRDLPEIIGRHAQGRLALDFACGAGRSTRLLKRLGYETVGVDISEEMLALARQGDPGGDYLLIGDRDLSTLAGRKFDLILSAFPFSSTSGHENLSSILTALGALLSPRGRLVVVEPTPEFYLHEWLSFTTRFAENESAKSGDPVKAAFRDRPGHPVTDILWHHLDYVSAFRGAGLELLETQRPLGRKGDPYNWVSENETSPWVVYVLGAR